jgi:putative ABC transport system substrate-binding protein
MQFYQLIIRRRDFITLLGGTAAAWPLAAHGQQPAMAVVGFLHSTSAGTNLHLLLGFHRGLMDTSYVEGENVSIVYRWAEGQNNRLPELAAELVHRQIAVIVAFGGPASVSAAKAATRESRSLTESGPIQFTCSRTRP